MITETKFHGDDIAPSCPENALFHIIPVPYEQSVSYGGGTAKGPAAILEASTQLEVFDNKSCPADFGLHTAPFVDCSNDHDTNLNNVKNAVAKTLKLNKIPVILGGEHTLTTGAIDALIEKHGDDFGVIQFDAHADLRDSYEGSKYSHACVMKRIFDRNIPFYQIGVRSYSLEEQQLRDKYNLAYLDAEELNKQGVESFKLPEGFPEKIFITFDIDGLDSSIIPATGTPVPGGIGWWDAMWLIERIMNQRTCIGFDVVEFSPIENFHCYNYTAAQLVYNIMGYLTRSEINKDYWNIR